ncbi:hypothetical protein PENTCL1PPCAC_12951, partial [Pristionchus entomophagus]
RMNQSNAALSTIEGWKRKTCEYYIQSDDALVPLISKAFDTMSEIHKPSKHSQIQRTLDSLDLELSLYRRSEDTKEPSLRPLIYGIMESLHLTLRRVSIPSSPPSLFVEPKEEPIDEPEPISIDNPRSKSGFIGNDFLKEEESIDVDLMGDDIIKEEEMNDDVIPRFDDSTQTGIQLNNDWSLNNGIMDQAMDRTEAIVPISQQEMEEMKKFAQLFKRQRIKFGFSQMDVGIAVWKRCGIDISQNTISRFEAIDTRRVMHFTTMCKLRPLLQEWLDEKESAIANSAKEADHVERAPSKQPMEDGISSMSIGMFGEEGMEKDDTGNDAVKREKESSETVNVQKKKGRPSRSISRPPKFEQGIEPPRKRRSRPNNRKENTTTQCILCEIFPSSASSFAHHLYFHHDWTTLKSNGIFLRCSCGVEFRSTNNPGHSDDCDGNEFTIHKLDQKPHSTLQCIECEVCPPNVFGYARHLHTKHYTTLNALGIFLRCSCGLEVISAKTSPHNNKMCDGREFTIHKLDINLIRPMHSTPKCILCETFPATVSDYASHLYNNHGSDLNSNGVFLHCSCGMDVRSTADNSDHSKNCDGIEFTIHKFAANLTPQCILCEAYPTTISEYATHISAQHKSNLNSNGIYLLCSCGTEIRSSRANSTHNLKCYGCQFTIHRLDGN